MELKKYNKLVRDHIPTIIRARGGDPITHTADSEEYWQKLREKFLEEVAEFNQEPTAEELMDVLEVMDAIIKYKNFDVQELTKVKAEKKRERGGFDKRIILDEA